MPSTDSYWVAMPAGMRPGQLSPGDVYEIRPGDVVVIVGSSTGQLLVRPLRLWERLWMRLFS
jgi:hypothetical protein